MKGNTRLAVCEEEEARSKKQGCRTIRAARVYIAFSRQTDGDEKGDKGE
jgi:hypothetical protein